MKQYILEKEYNHLAELYQKALENRFDDHLDFHDYYDILYNKYGHFDIKTGEILQ